VVGGPTARSRTASAPPSGRSWPPRYQQASAVVGEQIAAAPGVAGLERIVIDLTRRESSTAT